MKCVLTPFARRHLFDDLAWNTQMSKILLKSAIVDFLFFVI